MWCEHLKGFADKSENNSINQTGGTPRPYANIAVFYWQLEKAIRGSISNASPFNLGCRLKREIYYLVDGMEYVFLFPITIFFAISDARSMGPRNVITCCGRSWLWTWWWQTEDQRSPTVYIYCVKRMYSHLFKSLVIVYLLDGGWQLIRRQIHRFTYMEEV